MIDITKIYKYQGDDKDNLKSLEDIDLKSLIENLSNPIDNTFMSIFDLKEKENASVIAVAYSGGRDSLAHIIRLLKETDYYILPVINELENVSRIKESILLGNIVIKILSNAFPKRLLIPLKNINIGIHSLGNHTGIVQQPINCLGIIACNIELLEKIKEYHVCYIMNDTALSYLKELENLYYAFVKARGLAHYPKIKFPDIKVHKIDNLCEIERFERDYLDRGCLPTLTCEEVDISLKKNKEHFYIILEPCKTCDSCIKLNSERENNVDDVVYVFDREGYKEPKKLEDIDVKFEKTISKSKIPVKKPTSSKRKPTKSS